MANNLDRAYAAMAAADEDSFIVPPDKFHVPDMGDYYINAVDTSYAKLIDIMEEKSEQADVFKTSFYVEKPYFDVLGDYSQQGILFVKGRPDYSRASNAINRNDGDTIYIPVDTIEDGGSGAKEKIISAIEGASLNALRGKVTDMALRFLAIDAPEIPHWSLEFLDLDKQRTTRIETSKLSTLGKDYLYEKHVERKDGYVHFIRVGDKWHEYKDVTAKKYYTKEEEQRFISQGLRHIQILSVDQSEKHTIDAGFKAQKLVRDLIKKAGGEVYMMIDQTSLNRSSDKYPTRFGSDVWGTGVINAFKLILDQLIDYNPYRYAGFNAWGQDAYGRFLGTCYVKISDEKGERWINVTKYLIANMYDDLDIFADYSHSPLFNDNNGFASRAFRLDTYNYKNRVLCDLWESVSETFDDRKKIQAKIFGKNFEALKEWTVMIGDSMFFVPPTSIRVITQTTNERLPVVRAKGSIIKGALKAERQIEFTLYFNDEHGINGYPVEVELPNKKKGKVTYYMNGLRSLIAQFKFTPFLPIDNHFINQVLGIEAVTMVNMQVSTMPDYPRCLMARLVMQEFDYRQYMPELPVDYDDEFNIGNAFGSTINFETMRWYYQRAIMRGEEIKDIDVNSPEYIKQTHGQRTALIPMKFTEPYVKFYLANENHLDRMLQVKLEAMTRSDAVIVLTDVEKQLARDMAFVYEALKDMTESTEFRDKLKDLNTTKANEYYGVEPKIKALADSDSGRFDATVFKVAKENDGYWRVTESHEETSRKLAELLSYIAGQMSKANGKAGRTVLSQPKFVFYTEGITSNKGYLNSQRQKDSGYATGKRQEGRAILGVEFTVNCDYVLTKESIDGLRRDASRVTGQIMDNVFNKKKIFVPIHGFFATMTNRPNMPWIMDKAYTQFALDFNDPDIQFIAYCHGVARSMDNLDGDTPNEDITDMKQAIDLEVLETLKYDEYPLVARASTISVAIGNVYNRIGINGSEGYAPQYMGGQDAFVEIGIETTDENTVQFLHALPGLTTHYAREYRLVLPASPLKIESELTKLFGINEVVIEQVDVQTVPNQPGLYQVVVRMISMDRTLRNREALQKINDFYISGKKTKDNMENMLMRSYFELDKALGEAEVYPDLELPTIEELAEHGFEFLRYKFDTNRVYPDPDFYFIYPHVLTSQLWREAVLNSDNLDMDIYTWMDSYGGQLKTKVAADYGVVEVEANEAARRAKEDYLNTKDLLLNESGKDPETLQSKINPINLLSSSQASQSWDISEKIKVVFLEEPYRELLTLQENASNLKGEAKNKTVNRSQGDWVYEITENARKASRLIENYLNKKIDFAPEDRKFSKTVVTEYIVSMLGRPEIREIMRLLNICDDYGFFADTSDYDAFRRAAGKIVFACACAATGEHEYQKGLSKKAWHPKDRYFALVVNNAQDNVGVEETDDLDLAIQNAVEFGPYRIKMYEASDIKKITGEPVRIRFGLEEKGSEINKTRFLIDPYYRNKASIEEIEEYKRGCITNYSYATEAFFRIVLYMIKKMIDDRIFPNVTLDVLNDQLVEELEKAVDAEQDYEAQEEIEKYLKFVEDARGAINNGKIFAAAVLALTGKDIKLYEMMQKREYQMLNNLVDASTSFAGRNEVLDQSEIYFRKLIMALVGCGLIDKDVEVGKSLPNPAHDRKKILHEKKYIEYAEDPNVYIRHSFYDMIVNDKRGRMARAFPTFYILFVDEGREIGIWKLHDNFYNINSVSEIQIAKSRKIAADTARIVLSNFFHTFTTEDEDINLNYRYDWRNVFDSIFNPRKYYLREEALRLRQQPLNRARLTPGTRVHIRMGYSSNAATLPIVFNGKIAEVSAGEAVEIIAQGDGVELLNPIQDQTMAHEVQNQDKVPGYRGLLNLFRSGATPKTILDSLLTTKGGFAKKVIYHITNGYYNSTNPFGIVHFGDPEFDVVLKNGEVTQNIFEAISKPKWGDLGSAMAEEYKMDEAPKLTFEAFGKTFWDILHICTSVSPDYICGIAPFGMRSTIFHGAPRYYYAYEYAQTPDGVIIEKRKPYQQYHIYTSYTDIIKNDIRASDKEIKTNATGIYTRRNAFSRESQEKVGPIWVDWDIYPEHQKSMIYDTQLYGKGVPVAGFFIPLLNSFMDNAADDKGLAQGAKKIAWRMTVSALRDAMKDMYTGELIIIGDPTVKPHDRMYIHDTYENMNGCCLVEGVVHHFSATNGYTTTIYPDAIAVHDDRHELAVQTLGGNIVAKGTAASVGVIALSNMLGKSRAPIMNAIIDSVKSRVNKPAVTALKNTALFKKIADTKVFKEALNAAKTVSSGASGTGIKSLLGSSGAAMAAGLAAMAVEIAVVTCTTKLVYSALERWMASKQVLQVFPLKKNGKVYTAGLMGSKGMVYGSPSYEQQGFYDSLFGSITNPNVNPLLKVLQWIFLSDEMREIGARYRREPDPESGPDETVTTIDILQGVAEMQTGNVAGYKRHLFRSRINPSSKEALSSAIVKYGLRDTNAIETQGRIVKENVYLLKDPRIQKAIDEGIFEIVHNAGYEEDMYETKEFNISGERVMVNAIVETRGGRKIYDLPFLKDDALDVLNEIIVRASKVVADFRHEETEEKPKDFLLLVSALKVGDNSLACTGYSFILEAHGERLNNQTLASIVKDVYEDVKNTGQKSNAAIKELFKYTTDPEGAAIISVLPPAS